MTRHSLWVHIDGIVLGLIYAAIIAVVASLGDAPRADDVMIRAFFGFGVGVLMKRVLDSAWIEMTQDGAPRDARFHMGRAQGCAWGMTMILAFWPLSGAQVIIWCASAAFFGTIMGYCAKLDPPSPARLALYKLDKPMRDEWGGWLRFAVGPILMLAVIALFWQTTDTVAKPYLILAQMVVFLSLVAAFSFANRLQNALMVVTALAVLFVGYTQV